MTRDGVRAFELVETGEPRASVPGGPGDRTVAPGQAPSSREQVPHTPGPGPRHRRRLLVVLAAALLVAGGMIASNAWSERSRAEHTAQAAVLRAMPEPPSVLWRHVADRYPARYRWNAIQVVEETVVVEGPTVEGLDARTGEELWTVPAPEPNGECHGSGPRGEEAPLYCYAYRATSGTLWSREPVSFTALDPATGRTLVHRDLPGRTRSVDGAPDLRMARAHRDGRDAVLVLEDAVTGEVLWSRTVPYDERLGVESDEELGLSAYLKGDVAGVFGPGVDATFTLDGEPLTSGSWGTGAVPDGLRVTADADQGVVLDTRGREVFRFTGYPVSFGADDGSRWDGAIVVDGGRLVAFDARSGVPLWISRDVPDAALVRVGETGVFAVGGGLRAVDLTTGAVRWERQFDQGVVTRALTDGESVIAVPGLGGTSAGLVALAVADGSPRWEVALPDGATDVAAADGVLLVVRGREVTAYG